MSQRKPSVGNEFGQVKRTAPKRTPITNPRPAFNPKVMLPAEALRRATTPPVQFNFHTMQLTKTEVKNKSFIDGFAYDLLFVAAAFFVDVATPFRDWLFLAYLVVALVFRVSSQRIFRSALFCLVAIPILTQLKRTEAADSFAIFTFYFLCIGVIRAIIELRKE